MATKKSTTAKTTKASKAAQEAADGHITTAADLKAFLLSVRDGMADNTVAAIYAVGAIKNILNMPTIYKILDKENKELARDIWLRVKQSGMNLDNPPLLFSADEDGAVA